MDALLMCGGRGRRLEADVEKPLFRVGERPMVERVRAALADSAVDATHAVVSPHAPETRQYLEDLPVIDTAGKGYVTDLRAALDQVDAPVLTAAADLPLLDAEAIDAVLDAHEGGSLTVGVPAALKRRLGVSIDRTLRRDGRELVPAGVNIVDETGNDTMYTTSDVRFAVNVNRLRDAEVAEQLR